MHPIIPILLQAGGESTGVSPGAGIADMLPLIAIIFAITYFMIIRPQRKQQREHQQLLDALQKNDEVRTSGGIYGKVVSVEKDRDQVILKVDEQHNVRLRVARGAIVEVLDKKPAPEKQKNRKAEKAGTS